jgi:hypothetical protein
MDTWATQAVAHATLTSGISMAAIPVIGSASLDGFALGLSCAGLALAAINSPWKLRALWRPADVLHHTVRWSRPYGRRSEQAGTTLTADDGVVFDRTEISRPYADLDPGADAAGLEPGAVAADAELTADQSRIKQRVNEMLTQLLGDHYDEPAAEAQISAADDVAEPVASTADENSEPAEPATVTPAAAGYTPRHAAPPASFAAKLANPKLPGLASRSSHAGW